LTLLQAKIVIVQAAVEFPVFFSFLNPNTLANGKRVLQSTVAPSGIISTSTLTLLQAKIVTRPLQIASLNLSSATSSTKSWRTTPTAFGTQYQDPASNRIVIVQAAVESEPREDAPSPGRGARRAAGPLAHWKGSVRNATVVVAHHAHRLRHAVPGPGLEPDRDRAGRGGVPGLVAAAVRHHQHVDLDVAAGEDRDTAVADRVLELVERPRTGS
jgi:hypothetical protein